MHYLVVSYAHVPKARSEIGTALIQGGFGIVDNGEKQQITVSCAHMYDVQEAANRIRFWIA